MLSEGFGLFAFKPGADTPPGTVSPSYSAGIGNAVIQSGAACRPGYKDVICTHYGAENFDPLQVNAASCPGDSGGPLLDVTSFDSPIVYGVISNRESTQSDEECLSSAEALTTYTITAAHFDWINSVISTDHAATQMHGQQRRLVGCKEGMLNFKAQQDLSLLPITNSVMDIVSVSIASDETVGYSGSIQPPSVKKGIQCANVGGLQTVLSCQESEPQPVSIRFVGNALAQISICGYR